MGKANRDTASETVRTLLVYGYVLEPPAGEPQEHAVSKTNVGSKQPQFRTYRAEKTYAVSSGKWYFEFEVLTSGPMRVGWAKVEAKPGHELGQDDCSWAFDGWRVRNSVANFHISTFPYLLIIVSARAQTCSTVVHISNCNNN